MGGRTESSTGYRYGFNGKEKDSPGMGGGGNTLDYGFRIYNPLIAKFLSVDPLAEQFPDQSPYSAMFNNPIFWTDPTGMAPAPPDYYQNKAGEVKWFDNKASKIVDKNMTTWSNIGTSYVSFDGNSLDLNYQKTDSRGNISPALFSVPAVSGQPDVNGNFDYSQGRQEMVGVGPLPEGNYKIDPAGIQTLSLGDDIIGTAGAFTQLLGKKVGAWPGGNYSWGMSRLDITPKSVDVNGVSRSGFTIHGGQKAGSAGCIDCMRSETLFFDKLQKHSSGSILLKVDYSKLLKPIPSPFNSNGTGFKE